MCWHWWLSWPKCTLHLALLDLMRFTIAHISSLWQSLWMAPPPSRIITAPFSYIGVICRFAGGTLNPTVYVLIKIWNSIGPRTSFHSKSLKIITLEVILILDNFSGLERQRSSILSLPFLVTILAMHAQISNKRQAKNTQDKCFYFLRFKK